MGFTTKNKGTLLKAMLLSPKKKRIEQRSSSSSVFLKEKKSDSFQRFVNGGGLFTSRGSESPGSSY